MTAMDRKTASSSKSARRRTVKPTLTAPKRSYEAQPGGEIDYEALSEEVNDRFPHILKRLAE